MWEYKRIEIKDEERDEDYLDELGTKGWEAYAAFPKFPHSETIVVMLKHKLDPEKSAT
jgi:hypothetical protein